MARVKHDSLLTVQRVYEGWFATRLALPSHDAQLRYLLDAVPQDRQARILDAGCGDGRYCGHLAEIGYTNLDAIDLFDQIPVKGIRYQAASVDALPFPDASFDFVFSNSVVFYVDPPERALQEFFRVLKPEGRMMFTAHTRWSLFTLQRILRRSALRGWGGAHLMGIGFHSAAYYRSVLTRLGFKIELQDGWRVSFLLYPAYRALARMVKLVFGFELPRKAPYITRNRRIARWKSEIAYHSVFVVSKLKVDG